MALVAGVHALVCATRSAAGFHDVRWTRLVVLSLGCDQLGLLCAQIILCVQVKLNDPAVKALIRPGMGLQVAERSQYDYDYWNGRLLIWELPEAGATYTL